MPKKRFQDIVAPRRRRTRPERDFAPHHPAQGLAGRRRVVGNAVRRRAGPDMEGAGPGPGRRRRTVGMKTQRVAAAAAVLLLLFFISTMFWGGTTIVVTTKQSSALLDSNFRASKSGADDAEQVENGLLFETLRITEAASEAVPATEVRQVDRRASGQVVVYNDYSSTDQRLIKNTRFETPEGLIFRIRESVVVPGQKTVRGRKVPGSVVVTVYADETGEGYNAGFKDFTIPGFAGTPRFEAFYARSKTEMGGGFSGIVKTVSPEELNKARENLRQAIREKLLASLATQVPDGFVLYEDGIFIEFSDDSKPVEQRDVDESTVDVAEEGVLTGILFDKDSLGNYLAQKLAADIGPEDRVSAPNIEELEFAVLGKESVTPSELAEISFHLKGDPKFVWLFDEEKLRAALAGKPKDRLKDILSEFTSVAKAEVTIRPFWKNTFPADPEDIKVEKVIE